MSDNCIAEASRLTDADVIRDAGLDGPGLAHGFFTRRGGSSHGIYDSLNMGLGSKDDPDAVEENRARAMRFLGLPETALATPWQIHSADAVVVDSPFAGERPRADAVVTARPGLAVGVVTADCGPILFADAKAGVVGAAHAGWRGAVTGVLEATIEAMERCGASASRIVAVLGPTISQGAYEVGAEREAEAVALDRDASAFFSPGATADKRQFDLPGLVLHRLAKAGATARTVGRCTFGEPDMFFSFRRTTHRGEPDYGRQLAAIAITG